MSLENGKMKAAQFSEPIYFRAASHLWSTQGFERSDPLGGRFGIRSGKVSDRCQTRQSPFHELQTVASVEQGFVYLAQSAN